MYKFNFLAKINQQKSEEKKRNRLVRLSFFASLFCLLGLLLVLYFNSANIGNTYKTASESKSRMEERTQSLRNRDFFRYRNIQNFYNVAIKRKKTSSIMDAFENSLDSTLVITNFRVQDEVIQAVIVAKITGSRSQLMNVANTIKERVNSELLAINYVDDKTPVRISRFPEIRNNVNELQYWEFILEVELLKQVKKAPEKNDNEEI